MKCRKCGIETGPAFGLCAACIKIEDATLEISMANKLMTYAQAMRDFFYREGTDNLQSFMAELRALTAEDKAEFKLMLVSAGYEIKE
jgi:hypothetical protein